jgi:acyl carrier protein
VTGVQTCALPILNLIEDALELEFNSLTESDLLLNLPEYDSMAKLSLIVLSDDEFNKKLSGEKIREFKTVGDIVNFLIE